MRFFILIPICVQYIWLDFVFWYQCVFLIISSQLDELVVFCSPKCISGTQYSTTVFPLADVQALKYCMVPHLILKLHLKWFALRVDTHRKKWITMINLYVQCFNVLKWCELVFMNLWAVFYNVFMWTWTCELYSCDAVYKSRPWVTRLMETTGAWLCSAHEIQIFSNQIFRTENYLLKK